jgi:hypothetical protein
VGSPFPLVYLRAFLNSRPPTYLNPHPPCFFLIFSTSFNSPSSISSIHLLLPLHHTSLFYQAIHQPSIFRQAIHQPPSSIKSSIISQSLPSSNWVSQHDASSLHANSMHTNSLWSLTCTHGVYLLWSVYMYPFRAAIWPLTKYHLACRPNIGHMELMALPTFLQQQEEKQRQRQEQSKKRKAIKKKGNMR